MIRIKSLQQRLTIFLLAPVGLLLILMATLGFIYARNALLSQWHEKAILQLQRAAHSIDMRISRPKMWLHMYTSILGDARAQNIQEWLIERLKNMESVGWVTITWLDDKQTETIYTQPGFPERRMRHVPMDVQQKRSRHLSPGEPITVTPPRYLGYVPHETVTLGSDLLSRTGRLIGQLELAISFDYLLEDLRPERWQENEHLFLVDQEGRILTCNVSSDRKRLGETGDPLELQTLQNLLLKPSGTLASPGRPPEMISGFYRLREMPWTLVVMVPGREVLAPIIKFRTYYFIGGAVFILFILLLIRLVTHRTVVSIKQVAEAADLIARGTHNPQLAVRTEDEVGQLVRSFNTMALQLEERIRLKEALDLAMEVQQSLLPKEPPRTVGLDIAGKAIYCEQTGGDYFDFLDFTELGDGRVAVAVGDVVGHGIAAALLMTTVRSLVRSRVTQPGSLAEIITDVNRLLCLDTADTASFMTLFFMVLDEQNRKLSWVRAGHDPALVYDATQDSFSELLGSGIALGVDDGLKFEQYEHKGWSDGQIIIIGTDGIWETENEHFEMFGKERLREIVRRCRDLSAKEILEEITEALKTFQGKAPQKDDITLVVIKTPRHPISVKEQQE